MPDMTFEPLGDNVLVSVEERRTDGDFVIPETAKNQPQEGVVEAKGPLADGVNVGDRILFRKYSPDVAELGGKSRFFVRQEDIFTVIRD